jgi:predicted RNA-binding protein with PIN domain
VAYWHELQEGVISMKDRNKLLIVDGYNVLRSGSRYRSLRNDPDYTDDTFNRSREALIKDVIGFAGRDFKEAVIVFDGAANQFSDGKPQSVGGVKIIFSPSGSSADNVIEKIAHDARERDVETLVVSSDATIQDTVFGGGVDRMSAEGFSREARRLDEETELDEAPVISRKNTMGERLDSETYKKLQALRDRL